jgi:hypothetical protein
MDSFTFFLLFREKLTVSETFKKRRMAVKDIRSGRPLNATCAAVKQQTVQCLGTTEEEALLENVQL